MNKKILIGSIIAVAILFLVSSSSAIYVNIKRGNQPPDKPEIHGQANGIVGLSYEYVICTTDPDGDDVSYYIEWGDGTHTGWTLYLESGVDASFAHKWYKIDNYDIRCKAKDIYGAESDWGYMQVEMSKSKQITNIPPTSAVNVNISGDNHPPSAPKITGPKTVRPGTHEWTFKAIDPDGDTVSYYIDWDDGDFEDWFGPFESGEEVTRKHTVIYFGTVTIRARAKDMHGAIGDWGHFELEIPKSEQIINLPFLQFLERFPILNQLIMRLVSPN